jgi:hypothetical protein
MKVNFLVCLSSFHCRELCGVPEAECEQLQPRAPAECHLPCHRVLGVSGEALMALTAGGSVLPLDKARPFSLALPGSREAFDCFRSKQ